MLFILTLYNSPVYDFFINIANIVLIIAGFIKIREVLLKRIKPDLLES